jgi:putative Ca2+/H+ antiporter (TMEM165/GDT1 family)
LTEPVDVALAALVFGLVLLAELPDKTMFASLLLGTKFSGRWVFTGAAAAFLVHVVIAVAAGSLLGLMPRRVLDYLVAALFAVGAVYMLRESFQQEEDAAEQAVAGTSPSRRAWTAIASSFAVIFVGEWGDITQITTANLAARYQQPIVVGIGATLGLWAAALIAITAGRTLLRVVSVTALHRVGAALFFGLAVYTLVEAARA